MELNDHPDMSGEPLEYLPNPSVGRYLLQNSSSSGLPSAEQRGSGNPSEASANNNCVSPSSFVSKINMQSGSVIPKIEDILQQMVDCIIDEKELVLHLKSRIRS